jgi:cytidine deaminase
MTVVELFISDRAADVARRLNVEHLFGRARQAADRAYAPYSGARVGAALLVGDGEIITAGNVENSSYGLTICAERSAVAGAVAHGHRDFVAIAVAAETERVHTVAPCGACLQVLAEFDPDDLMVVIFPEGEALRVMLLAELLPVRFRLRSE